MEGCCQPFTLSPGRASLYWPKPNPGTEVTSKKRKSHEPRETDMEAGVLAFGTYQHTDVYNPGVSCSWTLRALCM